MNNFKRANFIFGLVVLFGAISAYAGYRYLENIYINRSKLAFQANAENLFIKLQNEIDQKSNILLSIQRYFNNSNFINESEFKSFSRDYLKSAGLQNICWHDGNKISKVAYKLENLGKDYCHHFSTDNLISFINEDSPTILKSIATKSRSGQFGYATIAFKFSSISKVNITHPFKVTLVYEEIEDRKKYFSDILNKKSISEAKADNAHKSALVKKFDLTLRDGDKIKLIISLPMDFFKRANFREVDYFSLIMIGISFLFFAFIIRFLMLKRYLVGQEVKVKTHALELEVEKRKEAQLQAEKLAKVKSQFLANMSHEIRTPMNGVLGMIQILEKTELNDEQLRILSTVRESGAELLCILNDILDVTRMEFEAVELDKLPFDITKLLNDVYFLYSAAANSKAISININLPNSESPPLLLGDRRRFGQVISNILNNAIKFTSKGSVNMSMNYTKESDEHIALIIRISDTGIGISKEDLEKLFNPFTQADSSITRKFGGSGLGLSIAKKLINIMGGEIQVESEVEVGTTFFISLSLPIASEKKILAQPDPSVSKLEELPKYKILVVEDNAINQKVIVKMLNKLGQNPSIANNGLEAVEKAKVEDYDIIFMDLQMPKLDGLGATKQILAMPSKKKPVIIALTANAFMEDRMSCLNAGMSDFIPKPVDMAELKRVLLSSTN